MIRGLCAVTSALLLVAACASAQELGPGVYWPIDADFSSIAGYNYAWAR